MDNTCQVPAPRTGSLQLVGDGDLWTSTVKGPGCSMLFASTRMSILASTNQINMLVEQTGSGRWPSDHDG